MPLGAFSKFDSLQNADFADWTAELWVKDRFGAEDRGALLFPTDDTAARAVALKTGVSAGGELLSVQIHLGLIFTLFTSWATVSDVMHRS